MFLPSAVKFSERTVRREAMLLLLRTGLAAARYRVDHGAKPSTLHELVPDYLETLPIDPYSNDSFEYSLTPHGYLLNSKAPGWANAADVEPSAAHVLSFDLRRK
jgi:hypothetical protein